jgi:hypothetical protein
MKTQLLEDIGESTAVSPLSSKPAGNSNSGRMTTAPAPARNAPTTRARAATGVWRQRLAGEPPAPTTQRLQEATPLELDKVFDEIAALEAQFVHPGELPQPTAALVEPQRALPASNAESLYQPGIALAEATAVPQQTHTVTAPQDPLFDFTAPAPAPPLADPFTSAPTGLARSTKRSLVRAACALPAALLIWGGWTFYQERNDAGSPALIAGQAKGEPRVDAASTERALP